MIKEKEYLTWAQIDLKAISYNMKVLKKMALRNTFTVSSRKGYGTTFVDPRGILAVIKADAYGHGMEKVGKLLQKQGVGFFAVSDINEGMHLRTSGIKESILLFESALPSSVKRIIQNKLTPTVFSLDFAAELERFAQKSGRSVPVHINVDTGMGRLGVWQKQAFDFIQAINTSFPHIRIEGIYTHFPVSDIDRNFTLRQILQLYRLVVRLDQKGLIIPYIHASNSMGLAGYRTHVLNLARPGLMIYGLYPSLRLHQQVKLRPAMSVKSTVIYLKKIQKGRSISYGRTFIALRNMTVATIPIGYNDGYMRTLSNRASVLIDGIRCPILGRVTMDQTVVDVSKIKNPQIGMPVTVMGSDGYDIITAEELAKHARTINYEIVCSLGNRLPRIYKF